MAEEKNNVSNSLLIVLLIIGGGFGLLVIACFAVFYFVGSTPSSERPSNNRYNVQYRVTGNSYSAGITYENADGNTEQRDISQGEPFTRSPWIFNLYDMSPGDFVYISAQTNHEGATIGCEIRVNGVVIESATSEGSYVIATCSGSVR